jgi:hypothetical protein
MGEFGIEPVERPVEVDRIGPAKAGNGGVVVGAVFEEEGAGLLERGHADALRYFGIKCLR